VQHEGSNRSVNSCGKDTFLEELEITKSELYLFDSLFFYNLRDS